MKFGVAIFLTDETVDPATLGPLVEQRGFESLWVPEHSHIPASRATPYPVGGELPREYSRTLDPFVTLATVAAVTTTLKLATGICLVVQRDPIHTAKEVATLDYLSGGRFLFGVGAGWNLEEMADHGTDPARRFGLLKERVEAMKAIWTQDEAAYSGRQVAFDPMWAWPKPVQRPHPPVIVGGNGKTVLDRVLAFGDEWLPNRIGDDERIAARIAKLRARGEAEGRGPIPTTLYGGPTKPEVLDRYEQAGVHRAVYWLPVAGADEVEAALDRYADLAGGYARAGA
ncbi:MAG: LLM class F420-dependent oxidoreductase [Solirubrobacteraceae bacterium]